MEPQVLSAQGYFHLGSLLLVIAPVFKEELTTRYNDNSHAIS